MGTGTQQARAKHAEAYEQDGLYRRGDIFWADITVDNKRYRRSLKTDNRREARQRLELMRDKLQAGRVNEVVENDVTLSVAVLKFLEDHVPSLKPKTQLMYQYSLNSIMTHMPNKRLAHYRKADFLHYENTLLHERGLASQTVINYLRVLSSVFEYACMQEWIDSNPLDGYIKRRRRSGLKRSTPRKRYLSAAEQRRLLEAATAFDRSHDDRTVGGKRPTFMFSRIVFAIETGLREDELRSLKWDDLNTADGYLTVREEVGKSGERRVPLTPLAIEMLQRAKLQEEPSEYVFPNASGQYQDNFDKAWRHVRHAAGLDDVWWHDLRRTCGCRLLERGFQMHEVQKWLGHASVTQTEQAYAFLEFDKLKGR